MYRSIYASLSLPDNTKVFSKVVVHIYLLYAIFSIILAIFTIVKRTIISPNDKNTK